LSLVPAIKTRMTVSELRSEGKLKRAPTLGAKDKSASR